MADLESIIAEMREYGTAGLDAYLGPNHMALCLKQQANIWADQLAALSQPVAEAVAWEYVLVHTNHPSMGIQSTVPMLTYSEREAFSAGAINQKALVYAIASSGLRGTGEGG